MGAFNEIKRAVAKNFAEAVGDQDAYSAERWLIIAKHFTTGGVTSEAEWIVEKLDKLAGE